MRRNLASAAALALIVAVAGCSSDGDERPPDCPRISVLNDAQTLTRFGAGPGRDLTDVDYTVEITDIVAGCQFLDDDDKNIVLVALAPVLNAFRGPANADRIARFNYFVSVLNDNQTILNKRQFDVALEFPGNRTRITFTDDDPPITVDIPIEDDQAAQRYAIIVGLQLTEEELEFNRQRAAPL